MKRSAVQPDQSLSRKSWTLSPLKMPSHAASSGEWPLRESPGSLNSVMSVAMTSPEAPAEKSWRSRRLGYPLETRERRKKVTGLNR